MINETLSLTVQAVYALALPLGTTIVAGGEGLDAPVRWATVVSPDGSLPYLEGHDLLLLMPGVPNSETLITQAVKAGAAVLVTLEPLPTVTLATAQLLKLPVLLLPPNSRVREVERAVLGLLLDRQGSTERRSVQIYQQLVALAAENSGLDRIIHELARLIDKAVVVQDKRLHVQVVAVPPRMAATWDALNDALTARDALPTSFQDRHRLPLQTTPTILESIANTDLSRLVTPIVNQNVGRGYLSFIAPTADFTEVDTLVNRHAAVVCALEMARAKAISEIEKRLRGDFLDSLMLGSLSENEAIAEGDRFGHDMSTPHIALVIAWQGVKHPSNRRLETLINGLLSRRPQTFFTRLHENELRLFYAIDSANPIATARQLAADIQTAARREYPDGRLAIGIGSLAARVSSWRTSYREAAQAADLSQRLKAETPLYIADLGIYTFLTNTGYRDDLLALRDRTIGQLINQEERQHTDLLLTLEAFFQTHGNQTQTAELLNVHRNTLGYRLNRITEMTGLDLDQPDVRLAVQLALKIHRLLSVEAKNG